MLSIFVRPHHIFVRHMQLQPSHHTSVETKTHLKPYLEASIQSKNLSSKLESDKLGCDFNIFFVS